MTEIKDLSEKVFPVKDHEELDRSLRELQEVSIRLRKLLSRSIERE
jgi:hypothetical protein|tara:strand:- start:360 stop:497 length:138 start_codon:yes stop_codon:yes gene_type:complete